MAWVVISLCLVALANVVLGQDSTPSPSSAAPSIVTASGSLQATHVVTVGQELNQFDPDSLTANVGDVIQFQFFPPNHSVGRAEYQQPCIPYEDTGENKVGFWSGFFPLDKILPNVSDTPGGPNCLAEVQQPPTWNLTINDTEPIFLYCAAPGSCINYQMVAVINPNDSVSLATQKEDASNAQYMLAPGQPFPSEAGVPSGDVNPGTNANATTSQSSSTQATTSSAAYASYTADASSQKLSTGAIVGIVIAGVAVAVLVGALFFLLGRQKTMLQFMRRNQYQAPGPQNPPEDQPDIRSPPPQMTSFSTASVIARSETPNYHEPAYDTPPYTRHAAQDPLAAPQPLVAELPSPGQKHMQEYVSSKAPMETEQHVQEPYQDSRVPTPQPQARPLTFWGRSRSTRAQTSELSAESPVVGRSPHIPSGRHQPSR
ncbi:MAG: hypothetical protein Q9161_001394 [Pseudevernia consocians]